MKLIIYLVLFGLLIYYIYNSNTTEKFTNSNSNTSINIYQKNFDLPNPYDILINPSKVSDNINNSSFIPGYNPHENQSWIIKNTQFSDIFNSQDEGSGIIYNIVNIPSGFNKQNVKNDNLKLLNDAINKDKNKLKSQIPENTNLSKTILYSDKEFYLIGSAINSYTNRDYLIYEFKVQTNQELQFLNEPLFEYLLVNINETNNKPVILYHISPRNKININDTVYMGEGPLQLGPLIIKKL